MTLAITTGTGTGRSLPPQPVKGPDAPGAANRDAQLQRAARSLEASFLAEMLGHAGLGEVSGSFGGGAGEAQFASLLRDAQAARMVEKGGIGLAEQLFHALKGRADAKP